MASHNIISGLTNLSIHFEYNGTDKVVICDGLGLWVSRNGSLVLHSITDTFYLNNTLCVLHIKKNLISIHHSPLKIMSSLNIILFFFLSRIRTRGWFYWKVYVKIVSTPYRSQWWKIIQKWWQMYMKRPRLIGVLI